MICSLIQEPEQWSRAVKDSCQLVRVFAFAVEGAAYGSKRLGERENVARHKQIGIFRSNRMPEYAFSCNRDFRDQIGSTEGDPLAGSST
jgi:hypothetical protein